MAMRANPEFQPGSRRAPALSKARRWRSYPQPQFAGKHKADEPVLGRLRKGRYLVGPTRLSLCSSSHGTAIRQTVWKYSTTFRAVTVGRARRGSRARRAVTTVEAVVVSPWRKGCCVAMATRNSPAVSPIACARHFREIRQARRGSILTQERRAFIASRNLSSGAVSV